MKVFLGLFFSISASASTVQVESVQSRHYDGKLVTEVTLSEPIKSDRVSLDFIKETVQLSFTDVQLPEKKKLTPINGPAVRNLYTYQFTPSEARFRVVYQKGISADDLRENIKIRNEGNKITFEIQDPSPSAQASADREMDFSNLAPVVTNEDTQTHRIDESEIEAAAEEMALIEKAVAKETKKASAKNDRSNAKAKNVKKAEVTNANEVASEDQALKTEEASEGSVVASSQTSAAIEDQATVQESEAEIPVLQSEEKKKEATGPGWPRIVGGLLFMAGLLGATLIWGKKWISKSKVGQPKAGIKILTQYHIAPKKSLAIIQVAGESILIGITDYNITPIKTLSLLDEEVPELSANGKFQGELNSHDIKEEATAAGDEDEFTMSGLKALIGEKLKGQKDIR